MRVLITGVAGLLGSNLARWILHNVEGARIFGVDDLSGGYRENVPDGVQCLFLELGDGDDYVTERMRAFKPEIVFHFAAWAAEGMSPFCRRLTYRSNCLATADVINAAIESGSVRRLVYTSSMAVYGRQSPPFSETLQPAPIDPYGVAKAACEADIKIAGEQHGLDWCIIRPHNVYGPHQNGWQDYRNVLALWMRQALQGKPLRIYGDGLQCRAFSFVDDCLPCLWQAATAPQASRQTINLGGIKPWTINEAAKMLCDVAGFDRRFEFVGDRHEVKHAWSTWDRSVDLLGFEHKTTLRDGLAKQWEWFSKAWRDYPRRRDADNVKPEINAGLYSWWQSRAS